MKKSFKKIVAGLCVLSMTPYLLTYAENASLFMSAKEGSSFIVSVNDENNDICFDESQIKVNIQKIDPFTISGNAKDVKHDTSNNVISGSFSGSKYIGRISFEIKAANTSADYLKEKAYMGFESVKSIKGEIYKGGFPRAVSECIKTGEDTYILHFDGWDSGDSYNFQIQGLDDVYGLEVKSYTVVFESAFYKVEATCSDGDGICAYLPASDDLNSENMTKWAINQCLLANSLKYITNNPGYDTIFYDFNGSAGYASASSISWTNCNDNTVIRSGQINFGPDATNEELKLIKLNSNSFNYFTMHEMSHVYNMNTEFDRSFNFVDEYVTNPRALTALQNCENIRNYKVRKENNANEKYETFSYDEVYEINSDYKANDDYIYYFAKNVIECCDWSDLETFYKAGCASEYDLNDTIDIAKKLADMLGITINDLDSDSIEGNKERFLKFVNMMLWLYSLSTGMEYNEDDFIKFIGDTFVIEKAGLTGLESVTKMLLHEEICEDETDTVVYGDANCDGNITIADAASIFRTIGNPDKYELSMKGALNADCSGNGDGVTPSDAIAIQKLIAGLINKLPVKMV